MVFKLEEKLRRRDCEAQKLKQTLKESQDEWEKLRDEVSTLRKEQCESSKAKRELEEARSQLSALQREAKQVAALEQEKELLVSRVEKLSGLEIEYAELKGRFKALEQRGAQYELENAELVSLQAKCKK